MKLRAAIIVMAVLLPGLPALPQDHPKVEVLLDYSWVHFAAIDYDTKGFEFYRAYGGLVTAFTIDPGTGVLTPTSPPIFTAGLNTLWVAVDPSGKFVYVTIHGPFGSTAGSGGVSAYSINPATGVLTEIAGSLLRLVQRAFLGHGGHSALRPVKPGGVGHQAARRGC